MPRCSSCGKSFHHSVTLDDGTESKLCLDCVGKAEAQPKARHARREHAQGEHAHGDNAQGEHGHHHAHGHHHSHNHNHNDITGADMKKGWLAMSALVVLALVLGYVVWSRDASAKEAIRVETETMNRLFDDLGKLDAGKSADAAKVIERIEQDQDTWRRNARVGEVSDILEHARTTLRNKDTTDKLDLVVNEVEKALADTATASARLMELRQKCVKLTTDAYKFSPQYGKRAVELHARLGDRELQVLHGEAKAQSGTAALTAYAVAEHEAAAIETEATARKATLPTTFASLRETVTAESDALADQLITEDFLKGIAAEDLLDGSHKEAWRPSASQVFRYTVGTGTLTADNPASGSGSAVILMLTEGHDMRDFALDLEGTVKSGSVTVFVRLIGAADNTKVPCVKLAPDGNLVFPLGEAKHCRIEAIGDRLILRMDGAPDRKADIGKKGRVGGIGLMFPGGSSATFTKFTLQKVR